VEEPCRVQNVERRRRIGGVHQLGVWKRKTTDSWENAEEEGKCRE
jgi:hypothetical protein